MVEKLQFSSVCILMRCSKLQDVNSKDEAEKKINLIRLNVIVNTMGTVLIEFSTENIVVQAVSHLGSSYDNYKGSQSSSRQ
ncbi:hypothetical protein RN001_000483 [Aquatica leii]|uniref:Uncharacterized protein n=1 Tax=Aquatica leii TaxID=1421715 RepID=A0AAN7Q749_9COLE|nr:hypothetical protein RN001_000483 [Aquatica leii]